MIQTLVFPPGYDSVHKMIVYTSIIQCFEIISAQRRLNLLYGEQRPGNILTYLIDVIFPGEVFICMSSKKFATLFITVIPESVQLNALIVIFDWTNLGLIWDDGPITMHFISLSLRANLLAQNHVNR